MLVFSQLCFSEKMYNDNEIKKSVMKLERKETRQEAIKEIKKVGKPAIIHLRKHAKDRTKDSDSRVSSIILIGKLKDIDSIIDIEEILAKDSDKYCREASAIALGNLGDKRAIQHLKKALKDESGNVRMRAVWALAKLGDKSGKRLALDTIKGKDVTAQLLAVDALEVIGDKDVIPELKKNLKSKNVTIQLHSKIAIKKIEMHEMSETEKIAYLKNILNSDELNNWSAVELVKIRTEEAINTLKEIYRDKDSNGSYSAYKVLVKMVEQGKLTKEDLEK